jgi:iron complex transport system permease protein
MNRLYVTFIILLSTAVLFTLSFATGSEGLSLHQLQLYLSGDARYILIFENIRLPQSVAALVAGGALALSGVLLQAVLKNPLASPFTLGISQASAFGASFAIIVLQSYGNDAYGAFITPLFAFISAMICTLAILFLGKLSQMKASSLILAGVAIGAMFNSMTMFLQYFADEVDAAATLFWTFGDLSKASMQSNYFIIGVLVPALAFFSFIFWKFDALLLGEDSAKALGVEVQKLQIIAMVFASLLSAITVSFLGVIGFIGLIAPHIVRLLTGSSHRYLIILSVFTGAALLLLADILSRSILLPSIVPVGILTSFLGAPLFLYLLSRKKQ